MNPTSATDDLAAPDHSRPTTAPTAPDFQAELRDMLATLFPEKAALLKKQNTANGVSLVFPSDVTEADEKWIQANVPEAMRIYKENDRALILGTVPPEAQETVTKRLAGLKDGKARVIVTAINPQPHAEPEGLHIAPIDPPPATHTLQLSTPEKTAPQTITAPITPDPMAVDLVVTAADEATETQFRKIEGDITGIKQDVNTINSKMGTMASDIIKALREDHAGHTSGGTQPAPLRRLRLLAKDYLHLPHPALLLIS